MCICGKRKEKKGNLLRLVLDAHIRIIKGLLSLSVTDVLTYCPNLTRLAVLVLLQRALTKVTTWWSVQEPSSLSGFQWTQQKLVEKKNHQLLLQFMKSEILSVFLVLNFSVSVKISVSAQYDATVLAFDGVEFYITTFFLNHQKPTNLRD